MIECLTMEMEMQQWLRHSLCFQGNHSPVKDRKIDSLSIDIQESILSESGPQPPNTWIYPALLGRTVWNSSMYWPLVFARIFTIYNLCSLWSISCDFSQCHETVETMKSHSIDQTSCARLYWSHWYTPFTLFPARGLSGLPSLGVGFDLEFLF